MRTPLDQDYVVNTGDRFVGRNTDRKRLFANIRLYWVYPNTEYPKMTVDHRVVDFPYLALTISGLSIRPHCTNATGGGQNISAFRRMDSTPIGRKTVAELVAIWELWHLNDLRGACIHQDDGAHVNADGVWLERWEWDDMILDQTIKCPEEYWYGSAWLVAVIPDNVVTRIKEIATLLEAQDKYKGN